MVFSEKAVSSQGWLRTVLIIASLMSEPTVLPSTDQATLKHCSKYQILKYSSEECQVEYLKLIHKKLVMSYIEKTTDGKATSRSAVNADSNYPYPQNRPPEFTTETSVALFHQILEKLKIHLVKQCQTRCGTN